MPALTSPQLKTAVTLCKAILRNGYDAYSINAPLQKLIIERTGTPEVDIACSCDSEILNKIFPQAVPSKEEGAMATLVEDGVTLHFYPTDVENASHPEQGQLRITPRLLRRLQEEGEEGPFNTQTPRAGHTEEGFVDMQACGCVKLDGIPSMTLAQNYLRAIRALRFAANASLPIDPATWITIIQSVDRILDYVPARDIMEEWRQVNPLSMWRFVRLLHETQILHGLIPELAGLACVQQERNPDGEMESVFDHTIDCMRHYPEGDFATDWIGVLATMFHDIGKLYTAEWNDGHWTFYQHHRVGAGITRKILRRLHFEPEDIDLVCHLVRHHMCFHFMLTDRGIRRFKDLGETARLMQICRADIKARGGSPTSFNHNRKYLERAETAEIMLEPLLNGNEIMDYTHLPPGPTVGSIRDSLLRAQKAGEVVNLEQAVDFVKGSVNQ